MTRAFLSPVLAISMLVTSAAVRADEQQKEVTRPVLARLDRNQVNEVSGIAASRKHPGVLWVHGDSGNGSYIMAVNTNGRMLCRVEIKDAPNLDWEDICADNEGNLYVGDLGDGGHFAVRNVYKISEPDPARPPDAAVDVVRKYAFRYPGNKGFDIESLFWREGELYIVAKQRWSAATLYRIRPSENTEADATLEKVTDLYIPIATAADASPDGRQLVVSNYTGIWIIPFVDGEQLLDWSAVRQLTYYADARVEGCTFAGKDLILAGEEGTLLRIQASDVETGAAIRFTSSP